MHRRTFLAGAAAGLQAARGANEKVVVGLIGCGGRGRYVARLMREAPGVEFAAVCDVYQPNAEKAREWAGEKAQLYGDFRRVLERKDIDAVLIATPDHWHAIPAVLACQAGKDVYVEKPLAHNVREGRAIVDAARKYNRIVQTGTQHRSSPHFMEIKELVQGGKIGDVRLVRVWNNLNMWPDGIGHAPDSDPPPGLDWDFWLGPAPKVQYNPKRCLSSFRWFWDYAGGFITDFGIHRFTTVHEVMGVESPRTVAACGGRFALKDAGEMPDTMLVTYEYPGFVMTYEMSLLNGHGLGGRTPGMRYYNQLGTEDRPHGIGFYGTTGTILCDRIGYDIYPEEGPRARPILARKFENVKDATGLHAQNFIECVRSRKPPNAEVGNGHRATLVAHLGNISLKTGRKLHWVAEREEFNGDPEAAQLLSRRARKPWNIL